MRDSVPRRRYAARRCRDRPRASNSNTIRRTDAAVLLGSCRGHRRIPDTCVTGDGSARRTRLQAACQPGIDLDAPRYLRHRFGGSAPKPRRDTRAVLPALILLPPVLRLPRLEYRIGNRHRGKDARHGGTSAQQAPRFDDPSESDSLTDRRCRPDAAGVDGEWALGVMRVAADPQRAPQTILIVEDDVPLRRLFRDALALAGFDVREAGDGYEELRSIDTAPPGLVVLDLALPALSGYVVREELAAQAHTRHIPVVVVTGSTGPEIYQLDADCVLTKPVGPDRLVRTVRRCLESGGVSQ